MYKHKRNKKSGITLISLVVTIIVLLILSGISLNMISGNNSIINKSSEAKIMADYYKTQEALEFYKIKKNNSNSKNDEITDKSLVGTIYKKVLVKDTKRELGVIVDFDKLSVSPSFGKGAKKLLEQDNNDINSVKEIDKLYDLVDIYAVDLLDGSLYLINGNQIYSQSKKVEVAENENISLKYQVELLNTEYVEKAKFKTKWNVTLGESDGSSTYSTVVLPVLDGNNIIYNATIDWGDGQTTLLQHRTNGITLTANELKEKVTHTYTLGEENDDGIREISISGIYSYFRMSQSTSTPSKLKLVELKQWGNVEFIAVNFSGCTNLAGNIPSPNVDGCFTKCTTLSGLFSSCSKLTGNIPSDLFDSAINCTSVSEAFIECSGLEGEIPNLFKNCNKITNTLKLFLRCGKLTSISNEFILPDSLTEMYQTFSGTGISEIPNTFKLPKYVISVDGLFSGCRSLNNIPDSFTLPNTVTNIGTMFQNCTALTELPDTFEIPDSVNSMAAMFRGASKLEKVSKKFRIPEGVTDITNLFGGCSNLKSLPDDFTIPSTMKSMYRAFDSCSKLTKLPDGFTIPHGVTNLGGTFVACSSLTNLPTNFSIPNTVTNMGATFARCSSLESLPENFVIPESVIYGYASYYNGTAPGMFGSCKKLKGTITIKGDITSYTRMFEGTSTQSGGTLTVNYSSNCSKIDDILATGDSNYIKKGSLVE